MLDDKIVDSEIVKKHYDELSNVYDAYENTLLRKRYHVSHWERLLVKDRDRGQANSNFIIGP